MMDSWKSVKLGDVAAIISDKKIDLRNLSCANYISTENMNPDRGGVEVAEKLPPNGKANMFLEGDTLFSNIRTYFKKVWHAKFSGGSSADVLIFRPINAEQLDDSFLYYFLSSDGFIEYTVKASKGTKMPRGDKEAMLQYKFQLPALPTQRRIASILSAYDDLIENNTRRITILEEMARRIYEEWFVRFHFPGYEQVRMIESEVGLIPEGWKVGRLGDVAKIQWGDTSLTKAAYTPEGYTAYSASGPDGLLGHFQRNGLGIVISAIGAQCGKTWFARGQWGCIKNTLSFWSANEEIVSNDFLFLQCNGESYWPRRGAAQPFISLGDARGCAVFLPSITLMKNFTSIVSPMFSLISSLNRKNANLRAQRDLLLPKLISGEIGVSAFPEPEAIAA